MDRATGTTRRPVPSHSTHILVTAAGRPELKPMADEATARLRAALAALTG